MKPSDTLKLHRQAILNATKRFKVTNPRVFGSTLHGTDTEESDLDLLVDALPGATLFDLGGFQEELQTILGVKVDVLTSGGLRNQFGKKFWPRLNLFEIVEIRLCSISMRP